MCTIVTQQLAHFRNIGKMQVISITLFVGIDRTLVLRTDFFAIPPLPVVVAVVVDLLDGNRRFRRNVIGEVVGPFFNLVFIVSLSQAGLTLSVLREFVRVSSNVTE